MIHFKFCELNFDLLHVVANFPQHCTQLHNCTLFPVDLQEEQCSAPQCTAVHSSSFGIIPILSELPVWTDAGGDRSSAAVCHSGPLTTCCQHGDETCSVTWWFTRHSAPVDAATLGCYGASSRVPTSCPLHVLVCSSEFGPTDKHRHPVSPHQRHLRVKSSFWLVLTNQFMTFWPTSIFTSAVTSQLIQNTDILPVIWHKVILFEDSISWAIFVRLRTNVSLTNI